jgi:hypothetical protein
MDLCWFDFDRLSYVQSAVVSAIVGTVPACRSVPANSATDEGKAIAFRNRRTEWTGQPRRNRDDLLAGEAPEDSADERASLHG